MSFDISDITICPYRDEIVARVGGSGPDVVTNGLVHSDGTVHDPTNVKLLSMTPGSDVFWAVFTSTDPAEEGNDIILPVVLWAHVRVCGRDAIEAFVIPPHASRPVPLPMVRIADHTLHGILADEFVHVFHKDEP